MFSMGFGARCIKKPFKRHYEGHVDRATRHDFAQRMNHKHCYKSYFIEWAVVVAFDEIESIRVKQTANQVDDVEWSHAHNQSVEQYSI